MEKSGFLTHVAPSRTVQCRNACQFQHFTSLA